MEMDCKLTESGHFFFSSLHFVFLVIFTLILISYMFDQVVKF